MNAPARIAVAGAFPTPRAAAMALLVGAEGLSVKQAQFLGGVTAADGDLSDKQREWLVGLLRRHGLPPLGGGQHG
jgi:hypothetical protein